VVYIVAAQAGGKCSRLLTIACERRALLHPGAAGRPRARSRFEINTTAESAA